jgi:hypothetical protein
MSGAIFGREARRRDVQRPSSIYRANAGAVRFPGAATRGSSTRRRSYAPIPCPLPSAMIRAPARPHRFALDQVAPAQSIEGTAMIKDAQICGFCGFYREGIGGGFLPAQFPFAPNRRADGAAIAGRNGPCSRAPRSWPLRVRGKPLPASRRASRRRGIDRSSWLQAPRQPAR